MTKRKGNAIIPFISGIAVVSIILAGILLWSNIQLKNQSAAVKDDSAAENIVIDPTKKEMTAPEPVVESKTEDPAPEVFPTKKTLPYKLPTGWATVVSRDGRLEIGFDPKKNQLYGEEATRSGVSFIGIWSTVDGQIRNLGYRYSFSIKPYDNGSRHNFLYRLLSFKPFGTNYDDLPENNFEREYRVQGWPCLVLFRIDISQWTPNWGVCPISSTEAISFSMDGDETLVEEILQTVRLLK